MSEPPAVARNSGFIDLRALRGGDASREIRLELGGGVILHLRRGLMFFAEG